MTSSKVALRVARDVLSQQSGGEATHLVTSGLGLYLYYGQTLVDEVIRRTGLSQARVIEILKDFDLAEEVNMDEQRTEKMEEPSDESRGFAEDPGTAPASGEEPTAPETPEPGSEPEPAEGESGGEQGQPEEPAKGDGGEAPAEPAE